MDGQELKIFVGGLHQDTDKESLNAYFSQYGFADSYIMMDKSNGRSRGFGFVNFQDAHAMESVLSMEHRVDGVAITCSEYQKKGGGKGGHSAAPDTRDFGRDRDRASHLPVLGPPAGLPAGGSSNPEMKIFVGGLAQETTKETLDLYFSRYGLADSYIMMDKSNGRSRGFGFVNFRDEAALHAALTDIEAPYIDGVTLAISEYKKGGGKGPPSAPTSSFGPAESPKRFAPESPIARYGARAAFSTPAPAPTFAPAPSRAHESMECSPEIKVFAGGLSQHTTKETLNEYFSQFGPADAYVMMDRSTGRSRGFGFVNFSSQATKEAVLNYQPHEVDGVAIECRDYQKGSGKGYSAPQSRSHDDAAYARTPSGTAGGVGAEAAAQPDATELLRNIQGQLETLTGALTATVQGPARAARAPAQGQQQIQALQSAIGAVVSALQPLQPALGAQPAAVEEPVRRAPAVQPATGSHGSSADAHLKVFVGGLSQETTKFSLDQYFCANFGPADSYIMMDKVTGRSRGFGFVNFSDAATKASVLELGQHLVDDVTISCSDYAGGGKGGGGKGGGGKGGGGDAGHGPSSFRRQDGGLAGDAGWHGHDGAAPPIENCDRLFIGGLAQSTTDDALREAFDMFGANHCEVMIDKLTGRSRGFGFVQFDSPTSAQMAISAQPFVIDGKQIECKECWGKGQSKGGGSGRSSPY